MADNTQHKNAISDYGIWTWGHVIYDYRGFLRNMKALGMNKLTIWNDYAPVNAAAILEEAHRQGIKVIWGFAWGWETDCGNTITDISRSRLAEIRDSVIKTYTDQYSDIAADGIYFQSFTELSNREINGLGVAEAVVELVNTTAGELLKLNPQLNIEFGLHATSVKADLPTIAKTDSRVRIVWEDLGAFPFAYKPTDIENFEATLALTEQVMSLRGSDERCGFIIKGMTTLDWHTFTHATKPLIIGESSREFIEQRQLEKDPIWAELTEGWAANYDYAQRAFELMRSAVGDISVQGLIEDGMFENEIKQPARMFAQLCSDEVH